METKHANSMANAGIVTRVALIAELGIKDEETVRVWEREGCPYIKQGNTIVYYVPDVVRWMRRRQRKGRK